MCINLIPQKERFLEAQKRGFITDEILPCFFLFFLRNQVLMRAKINNNENFGAHKN